MSTSKHIDKICIAAVSLTLVLTILFMCGGSFGIAAAAKSMKYESTLFDTSYVHKIDIVMNDWDTFIENCESEEYSSCTVVIDGKKHSNIAIRAKGNTSLSSVRSMGSQRYSFKLEFDHYEDGKNCDGLDKLCLNNLIQDNTMMKDYLVYQLMDDFGADAPLCSFAYITVNGEDWGLYLAVEGVEDSFLSRNYGSDAGELYKPDSMGFGGGRGNGKDFNMDDFDFEGFGEQNNTETDSEQRFGNMPQMPGGFDRPGGFPQIPSGDGQQGNFPQMPSSGGQQGGFPQMSTGDGPQGGFPQMPSGDGPQDDMPQMPDDNNQQFDFSQIPGGMSGEFGGRGSNDVKLKYIDDDPDSYSNIFDSAKTDISSADEKRLISALKNLSEYTDLENTLDTDEVLRYFVVHNFVVNGDSYTGSMIHNYYLHEKDGRLGMIPWDYNLAFGTFQGGSASSSVNDSIDEVLSDRPMQAWIFSDEQYTERYHELFSEFIEKWFANGELASMIEDTAELLRPYVEKDPTKFCTVEDFEKGVSALSEFVTLRAEAVNHQLNGDNTTVETGGLNLSDMGTMGGGFGGGFGGGGDRSFDISSMLIITDKDGNKVDVSELIGDITSIASAALSDGTTVELSSFDINVMRQLDLTKIVSVTDKDGNVIDLSDYTISFSMGGMQGGNRTSGNGSKPSSGNESNPRSDIPTQGDDIAEKENADGRFDSSSFGKSDGQGNSRLGENISFDPRSGGMSSNPTGTSDTTKWILVGGSVLVLAAGLFVATKKKY